MREVGQLRVAKSPAEEKPGLYRHLSENLAILLLPHVHPEAHGIDGKQSESSLSLVLRTRKLL